MQKINEMLKTQKSNLASENTEIFRNSGSAAMAELGDLLQKGKSTFVDDTSQFKNQKVPNLDATIMNHVS